jgi:hypothetical protein
MDGGIDAGVDAGLPDAGPVLTGVLLGGTGALPAPIAGLAWTSSTGATGVTDAFGTFTYTAGALLTFQASSVTFAPVPGAPVLSPFNLVAPGTCHHSTELEKALVLIYSLDADGNPATGTVITAPTRTPTTPLVQLSLAGVDAVITTALPGRVPFTANQATDLFVQTIDDESWTELYADPFIAGFTRSQGVVSDGTSWYFSSQASLEKTDLAYNQTSLLLPAIPVLDQGLYGSNHIGDIDVANGTLYAPVEDGPAYANPRVILYDTATLTSGTEWTIPQTLQTAGVPWIAVNPDAGVFYLAEWSPTTQLNLFSLDSGVVVGALPIRTLDAGVVKRIQGAKMFEGALYGASDDSPKYVLKVNLETGTVLDLFTIPITTEQEGLAFLPVPDGGVMHTLNVTAIGTELRHHNRTRLPLRKRICSGG